MSNYQPFLISEFKSGISTYLQPWARPIDAFDPLVNAYVYRGIVNKRAGFTQFGNTLPDNNPVMGIMKWLDPTNAVPELVVASKVNLYYYDPGSGNYTIVTTPPTFTGNITNFFNWTNWQPTSGSDALLWMCNGKDAVTNYNGATSTAAQPTITIDGSGTTITTALDIKVYKQRLLLIRPTLSAGGVQNQAIYWSKILNPANWLVDVAGNGGFIEAPTGDTIVCSEFVRDVLVVFFTNSTWIFRFTGNANDPFRWDKVNDSRSANCSYASVDYDSRCTAIGNTGLISCDGVNVQRYDQPIVDYYKENFSEQYFSQAFSQRYDNLNQAWTLYVSNNRDIVKFPLVGGVAPGSDKALIYNFAEDSWATYAFNTPLTCLGLFYNPNNITWASLTQAWDNTDIPWESPQKNAPILLAGSTNGKIYYMDNELAVTDNGTSIVPDIVTTRWNPVLQTGQKTQFGHIDIYYYVASEDPANPVQVTLNFYVDNSNNIALTKVLTLDGPVGSEYTFKRIYLNLVGEFVQMEIDPNVDSLMKFLGFIIWARPAGRLTP